MDSFGVLLRRHRIAAVLTQEALAERAGISAAGIAALEAGRRRAPRVSTVSLLLNALELDGDARAELLAVALGAAPRTAGHVDEPPPRPSAPIEPPNRDGSVDPRDGAGAPDGNRPPVQRRFAFVGRAGEVAALDAAWIGKTPLVVVAGEAGAGKTRLVGEFASSMGADATVLWGRCTRDRLGAYEPFVDPIRTLTLGRAGATGVPEGATPDESSDLRELARLVPELVLADGRAGPSRADPGVERRLLFDAVARCLERAGPVLLVLDDLHWADQASIALLGHLVVNVPAGRLVTIAVVRDTDIDASLTSAIGELSRVAAVARIHLGGLSGEALWSLIESVAGRPIDGDLVASITDATDGNPFFVEELTEHLLSRDDAIGIEQPTTASVVPRTVRETLAQRIDTLSPPSQALVRAGAVLGRTFDVDLAGDIADLDGEALLAATEDSLLSGLVTELSPTSLSFSHALVQSAVYESTIGRRRLELHRRAALRLEDAIDDGPTDSAIFDIARHWTVVAEADRSAERTAARWAMRAGDAAAAATDVDEAIERYRQAERLLHAGTVEHAEALIRLGSVVTALGRLDEADQHLRAAQQLADALGDEVLFARAVIGRSGSVRYGHSDPDRIAALERSIAALGPDQQVLRITAASMLKRQLGYHQAPDAYQRRQAAARLVLDAVTAPDVPTELLLSLGSARDSMAVDDPGQLGRLSRMMIDAATSPRNLGVLANGWFWRAWSALELGDLAGWTHATASFTRVAEELRLPFEQSMAAMMAATVALLEGRYAESEARSQEALTLGIEGGDPNAYSAHLIGAVLRGLDRGEAPEMIGLMKAMRAELADVPTFMAGLTMTAAVAGDHDLARELLADHARDGFERAKKNLEWLPALGFLSLACAVVGDRPSARVLHDELITANARGIRIGPLAAWFGPVDHHLGALCRVLGRYDEAETRLRAAIRMDTDWASRPWLARSQAELAATLSAMGDPTRQREASALRGASAALIDELAAPGIAVPMEGFPRDHPSPLPRGLPRGQRWP